MEDNNLELFYDVVEESINIIYEQNHKNYFEMLLETFDNIIACEVLGDYDENATRKLLELYEKLSSIDFSVEDVRKAIQALVLKGFKETNMPNIQTPDTLGFLIAYLISRFISVNDKEIKVLDPICGTGNLIFSLSNHLKSEVKLFGIEHNELMVNIVKATSNLLDTNVELYFQDTFNVNVFNMDFVVFDSPICEVKDGSYFLYDLILHHSKSIKDKGYMIGIIPDDFFDFDKEAKFKKQLLETMTIIGLIELPSDFFINQPKSIVVLKKEVIVDKKCLMVKLPSFNNIKEFNNSLLEIEKWFEKNNK